MLYRYTPVQKQTKERIWEIPYIPKKQRTSITNLSAPKKKRTFGVLTTKDGKQYIIQYIYKKEVSRIEMPLGMSSTDVLKKLAKMEV